ncbi:MAG: LA_2272 family surface repeat-containing protein [Puniceicoccaceae bacterium]
MTKRTLKPLLTLLGSLILSAAPLSGMRDAPATGVEFSIFHPLQLHTPETSVEGVRFNVFYAKNASLRGLDLSIFGVGHFTEPSAGLMLNFLGSVSEDEFTGFQTGLVTYSKVSFVGVKGGALNLSKGEMVGWQTGWVSIGNGRVKGLQTGLVNYAEDMNGVQFGLVNVAKRLKGVQIGLGNVNQSGPLVFFPFVNAAF